MVRVCFSVASASHCLFFACHLRNCEVTQPGALGRSAHLLKIVRYWVPDFVAIAQTSNGLGRGHVSAELIDRPPSLYTYLSAWVPNPSGEEIRACIPSIDESRERGSDTPRVIRKGMM